MELRDYQDNLIRDIDSALVTHRRVCVCAPTGAGKTVMAAAIAERGSDGAEGHVYFVVDKIKLSSQALHTFENAFGLKCSILQGSNTRIEKDAKCTIATIQTLMARIDQVPAPTLILIDECHIGYESHRTLVDNYYPDVPVIGLSATPLRGGMDKDWDCLVKGPSTADLIGESKLVPTLCYGPSQSVLDALRKLPRKRKQDWRSNETSDVMRTLVGDVVGNYQKLGENRKCVAFCVDITHAEEITRAFNQADIPARSISYQDNQKTRDEIYTGFSNDDFKILVTVDMASIGFDEPSASCLILARPTMSTIMHIQQCGRGIRIHQDKDNCIILDMAGNLSRHGLPDEFEVKSLMPERAGEMVGVDSDKTVTTCPECQRVHSANMDCPSCAGTNVEVIDANLTEINACPLSPAQVWTQLVWLLNSDNGLVKSDMQCRALFYRITKKGNKTLEAIIQREEKASEPSEWLLAKLEQARETYAEEQARKAYEDGAGQYRHLMPYTDAQIYQQLTGLLERNYLIKTENGRDMKFLELTGRERFKLQTLQNLPASVPEPEVIEAVKASYNRYYASKNGSAAR